MIQRFRFPALFVVAACIAGCNDPQSVSHTEDSSASTSTATANVAKVAVMVDGTVMVNSEAVPVDSLAAKLDSLGDITEVWYHREAPDAAEPHENAMKAIAEIANRKLPIAMYLDREFTQRASFGE